MSGNGEKAPPVNLAEDLDVSSDSSEEDEAAVAVSSQEVAMDQGEVTPPAEPRPEPRAAATADTRGRPSARSSSRSSSYPHFSLCRVPLRRFHQGQLEDARAPAAHR